MDLRSVGLQSGHLALHFHCLGHCADFQAYVYAGHVVERHWHFGPLERLKSFVDHLYCVGPTLDVREAVSTGLIAGGLPGLIGLFACDGNGSARDCSTSGVLHVTHDRTIQHLGLSVWRRRQGQEQDRARRSPQQGVTFLHASSGHVSFLRR